MKGNAKKRLLSFFMAAVVTVGIFTVGDPSQMTAHGETTVNYGSNDGMDFSDSNWANDSPNRAYYFGQKYRYDKFMPILWRVLEVKDGKALMLADNTVNDHNSFGNSTEVSTLGVYSYTASWAISDVREYLNNEFKEGLPEVIQDHLIPTRTTSYVTTYDHVYLLTGGNSLANGGVESEYTKYTTDYRQIYKADIPIFKVGGTNTPRWWVRNAVGNDNLRARAMNNNAGGRLTEDTDMTLSRPIRPALRLSNPAEIFNAGAGTPEDPYKVSDQSGSDVIEFSKWEYVEFGLAGNNIKWMIVDIDETENIIKLLAMSMDFLIEKPYRTVPTDGKYNKWSNSLMRMFLNPENDEYIENTFNFRPTEYEEMLKTTINTVGDVTTEDKMFLLSEEDTENPDYFKGNGRHFSSRHWYLRTAAGNPMQIRTVRSSGVGYNDVSNFDIYSRAQGLANTYAYFRPSFTLDLSSVIFASEVVTDTTNKPLATKGSTADNTSTDYYSVISTVSTAANSGIPVINYKLTLVNEEIELNDLKYEGKLVSELPEIFLETANENFELTGNVGDADEIWYKIVHENTETKKREIVNAGKGSSAGITVVPQDFDGNLLEAGIYTVHVWAQKNYDYSSHEGSQTQHFILNIGQISVDEVKVSPPNAVVIKGETLQFDAEVIGKGLIDEQKTVTWAVVGGSHPGTTISNSGVLAVNEAETAENLTVTATSTFDTTKSGTAVVTVNDPDPVVTDVLIDPQIVFANKGESKDFTATVIGMYNPPQDVIWTISGGAIGSTISDTTSGITLTVGENETEKLLEIIATSEHDSTIFGIATVIVNDNVLPEPEIVSGVAISPVNPTVYKGDNQSFEANYYDMDTQEILTPVEAADWTVLDAITKSPLSSTTINESGLLIVDKDETSVLLEVTATDQKDAKYFGKTLVAVHPSVVTSVTVSAPAASVAQGSTLSFSAEVTGMGAFDASVDWKVSGSKWGSSIDVDGVLTVVGDEAAETLTITAISKVNPNISGELTVTVTPAVGTITGVIVSPQTANVEKGNTQIFTANVQGTGNFDNTVTWAVIGGVSSDTTIDASGLLFVASDETAEILTVTATSTFDNTKFDTAEVTVVPSSTPTITSVIVSPQTATVEKGNTQIFIANVKGTGNFDNTVTWAVGGGVSSATIIKANGVLTVAADETAEILTVTATSTFDNTKFDTAEVTVVPSSIPTITGVTVSPKTATVEKGKTQTFTANVKGTGNFDNTVTWAVSGGVSSATIINANGVLTVAADETAEILTVAATSIVDSTKFDTAVVTVVSASIPTVTGVIISPEAAEVAKGGTCKFTAIVTGTNNPPQTVTWSVSGGVLGTTIDTNGMLTISVDETAESLTVTATSTYDLTKSGMAEVTVIPTPVVVTGVTISPSSATVIRGTSRKFTATVEGSGNPAQTVTWTVTGGSDTTINQNGILRVSANETANELIITATSTVDTTISCEAKITVISPPPATVTGVTVYPRAATVARGESRVFTANVTGTGNPSQAVTWEVTGGGLGTSISQNGVLTVAANEAATRLTVTATSIMDSTKSGSTDVFVVYQTPAPPATPYPYDPSPSSPSATASPTPTPVEVLSKEKASDIIEEAVAKGESAIIILDDKTIGVDLDGHDLLDIIRAGNSVIIQKGKVQLIIDSDVLRELGVNKDSLIEVKIVPQSTEIDKAILDAFIRVDSLNRELLKLLYDITLKNNGRDIGGLQQMLEISLDVSELKLTDRQKRNFTGIYFDDELKTYSQLGGEFSANGKTFIFSTPHLSKYSFAISNDLTKIKLRVGDTGYSVNGLVKTSDVAPVIKDDRTIVPLRVVAEALNAQVGWDDQTKTVIITSAGKTITLQIGVPIPGNMGMAEIINERTFVPIRYIAEQFNSNVVWNNAEKAIAIYK